MRPFSPVPATVVKSTPTSRANRRIAGPAATTVPPVAVAVSPVAFAATCGAPVAGCSASRRGAGGELGADGALDAGGTLDAAGDGAGPSLDSAVGWGAAGGSDGAACCAAAGAGFSGCVLVSADDSDSIVNSVPPIGTVSPTWT